jgi:hypothetical protein
MLVGARDSRDLAVGDVTDEHVEEAVLVLAGYGGTACPLHEMAALQDVEPFPQTGRISASDRSERARPEHLADHGGILEQRLGRPGQRIEASGNHALDRFGQAHRLMAFEDHSCELLGVERITTSPVQHGLDRGGVVSAAQQVRDQGCHLVVDER